MVPALRPTVMSLAFRPVTVVPVALPASAVALAPTVEATAVRVLRASKMPPPTRSLPTTMSLVALPLPVAALTAEPTPAAAMLAPFTFEAVAEPVMAAVACSLLVLPPTVRSVRLKPVTAFEAATVAELSLPRMPTASVVEAEAVWMLLAPAVIEAPLPTVRLFRLMP